MPTATVPSRLPITAIVIFRNEEDMLPGCLEGIRDWCDQIIAVDMQSTDRSLSVAKRYADRTFRVPPYPIAEPTRVAAAVHAKHDWILLIDPDEHIPPRLVPQIRQIIEDQPDAGAIRLPLWYYFKRSRLDGTVWGGDPQRPQRRGVKRMLIHRQRCDLLPYCNRITEVREGYQDATIAHDGDNHIRHYWCDSYRKLLWKHVSRYSHLEAAAQVAEGQRFSLDYGFIEPLRQLHRCLRHYDGWRLGLRGFALSTIYFIYSILSCWLVLYYQLRGRFNRDVIVETTALPILVEHVIDDHMTHFHPTHTRQAA